MMDDEQQIAEAIAPAFETLSDRLSKELDDAFNQMAQLMGRAQKQQYEIMYLFGKQAQQWKRSWTCCEGAARRCRARQTNMPPLSSNYCRAR